MGNAPWYRDGLCFECTRCGNCCTGAPGTVRVVEAEIAALAGFLGLEVHELRATYTRKLPGGAVSLRERPNGDCVFWERGAGCRVYPHRPRQCRTWPFWRANLETPEHWEEAARGCPGIGRGPLVDAGSIARARADDGTLGSAPGPA